MLQHVTTKSSKVAGKTKAPTFAEVGREAMAKAQRELLLRTADEQNWNLTAIAEVLQMGSRSAVIRALNKLAPAEYEKAKNDGRVNTANRRN